jgi:hypothetical protein
MTFLFIDDERLPEDVVNLHFGPSVQIPQWHQSASWIITRSYDDTIAFLDAHGCPNHISFDNDLGQAKEGKDIARWLIEKDLDLNGKFIPVGFKFFVHSQNIIARQHIQTLLSSYLDQR